MQTKIANSRGKAALGHAIIVLLTLVVAAVAGEIVVRIKNADQRNYYVEMWEYSRELKQVVDDKILAHRHIPNAAAKLQGVEIKINSLGLRGPEPDLNDNRRKRVLLLGSSITLGWGVKEENTLRAKLESKLNGRVQVMNAGVGNYNSVRYVRHFEQFLARTRPDVIVVQYFVNDAEILPPPSKNPIMRNSQLAALVYHALVNAFSGARDISALVDHYRDVYRDGSRGRMEMENALERLAAYAQKNSIRVILAMTPDIHQLKDYPFAFIHDFVRQLANRLGWTYVDFLDSFRRVGNGKSLYAIPGDPHPNALGHELMARDLAPYLEH